MFSELPNFFDRDFAVGYFLPVVTFLAASLAMATAFNVWPALLPTWQTNLLVGTTIFAASAWLLAIVLVGTNRTILQFLEGYGKLNPLRLICKFERSRYNKLTTRRGEIEEKLKPLDAEYEKCIEEKRTFPEASQNKRDALYKEHDDIVSELAERFPEEQWLLPTAYGNTIRAFETYSQVMYGMDAIVGWNRLLTVIPQDFREMLDEAKAEMDFWVNIWVLAAIIIGEYGGLALWTRSPLVVSFIWVPVLAILVIIFAQRRARSAAIEWGDLVKASFDVYLPALRVKMSFPTTSNWEEERKLWADFSQAVIYRDPPSLPSRTVQQPQERAQEENDD